MYQNIHQYIERFVSLNSKEISIVNECFGLKSFPKKTVLINVGDVCNFEMYVLKGCVREYFIVKRGVELTLAFSVED